MVICMYMMYKYIISYYYQYSVIYYVAAKSYLMYALLQDQQSTRPSYLLTYLCILHIYCIITYVTHVYLLSYILIIIGIETIYNRTRSSDNIIVKIQIYK